MAEATGGRSDLEVGLERFIGASSPDRASVKAPREVLAFLMLTDVISRLDILILEIRHLQVNVVSYLRQPDLYLPLRLEEEYIWGSTRDYHGRDVGDRYVEYIWSDKKDVPELPWCSIFSAVDDAGPGELLALLSSRWLLDYPLRWTGSQSGEASGTKCSGSAEEWLERSLPEKLCGAATDRMTEVVAEVCNKGRWSTESCRTYDNLRALQQLKRLVFRDKLSLVYWGFRAFGWTGRSVNGGEWRIAACGKFEQQCGFLIGLRRAVLANLHGNLGVLGDLKAQFIQITDLSFPDVHRPMQERRREQGLYPTYLSDQASHYLHCLGQIVDYLRERSNLPADSAGRGGRGQPPIFHRWHHELQSSVGLVSPCFVQDGGEHNESSGHIRLINSSYFMHDRPDLIPTIAHEVSHHIVNERYGELDVTVLGDGRRSDCLLRFLQLVHDELRELNEDSAEGGPLPGGHVDWRTDLVREIACDLLSTAILGSSYLYALTLEIAGTGLEDLYRMPEKGIDLGLAHWMAKEKKFRVREIEVAWFYRLFLVCCFVRETAVPLSELDRMLVEGVEALLTDTGEWLRRVATDPNDTRDIWRAPVVRLGRRLKDSAFIGAVRDWRKAMERLRCNPRSAASGTEASGTDDYIPNAMRRLPVIAQKFLIEELLRRKRTRSQRLLCRCLGDRISNNGAEDSEIGNLFKNIYGIGVGFSGYISLKRQGVHGGCQRDIIETDFGDFPAYLFARLTDIPWQSAIFRALDFVSDGTIRYPNKSRNGRSDVTGEFCAQINRDLHPGAELYHLALEVDYWDNMPAYRLLPHALRIVDDVVKLFSAQAEQSATCGTNDVCRTLSSIYIGYQDGTADKGGRLVPTDDRGKVQFPRASDAGAYPYVRDYDPSRADVYLDTVYKRVRSVVPALKSWADNGNKKCVRNDGARDRAIENIARMIFTSGQVLTSASVDKINFDCSNLARNYTAVQLLDSAIRAYDGRIVSQWQVGIIDDLVLRCKLEILREELEKPRRDDSGEYVFAMLPIFSVLYDYLAFRCRSGRSDVIRYAFLSLDHDGKDGPRGCFKLMKLSAISSRPSSVGAMRLPAALTDSGKPSSYLFPIAKEDDSTGNLNAHLDRLLGRFDALLIKVGGPNPRWTLPRWTGTDKAIAIGEPFFERREMGIPFLADVRAGHNQSDAAVNTLGYIFVSLGSRGYRLGLLRRLVGNLSIDDGTMGYCSHLGQWLGPKDRVFVAEGFGDIVVEINCAGYKDSKSDWMHLRRLFILQRLLYDDFCVDRTETLLTTRALSLALHKKNIGQFSITVMTKMMEDRNVAQISRDYELAVFNATESLINKAATSVRGGTSEEDRSVGFLVKLVATPGQLDYVISFDSDKLRRIVLALPDCGCMDDDHCFTCSDKNTERVADSIYSISDHRCYVDDVMTVVGYLPDCGGLR